MTDEQAAWLHKQIDEDESMAQACSGDGEWRTSDIATYGPYLGPEVRAHMAEHDPGRTLREAAFKRRILAIHRRRADVNGRMGSMFDDGCNGCGYEGASDDPLVEHVKDCPERRALAKVYANRVGYREMWGKP